MLIEKTAKHEKFSIDDTGGHCDARDFDSMGWRWTIQPVQRIRLKSGQIRHSQHHRYTLHPGDRKV